MIEGGDCLVRGKLDGRFEELTNIIRLQSSRAMISYRNGLRSKERQVNRLEEEHVGSEVLQTTNPSGLTPRSSRRAKQFDEYTERRGNDSKAHTSGNKPEMSWD